MPYSTPLESATKMWLQWLCVEVHRLLFAWLAIGSLVLTWFKYCKEVRPLVYFVPEVHMLDCEKKNGMCECFCALTYDYKHGATSQLTRFSSLCYCWLPAPGTLHHIYHQMATPWLWKLLEDSSLGSLQALEAKEGKHKRLQCCHHFHDKAM